MMGDVTSMKVFDIKGNRRGKMKHLLQGHGSLNMCVVRRAGERELIIMTQFQRIRTNALLAASTLVILINLFSGVALCLEDEKIKPCTGGYGILDETDDLIDLEDNQGCNFLKGEVPYLNNTCEKLLEQGPCRDGEWLVIDEDEDMLMCKKRECPSGQVMYDDECQFLNDNSLCKPTFELIINEHGEGECECPAGHLYHPETDRCYVPYTQGPCKKGYIIKMKVKEEGGIGKCRRNPCPREKMTPLDHRCLPKDNIFFAKCYEIGKKDPCKENSYLLIEPTLAKPFCLDQVPNSIVPRLVKRASPCHVSYRRSCVRECDGPRSYIFMGSCARNYAYFYNFGNPICLRGRCKRKSL